MYPNAPHAYGIETADGFQVLHLRRYAEFWTKMVEAGQAKTPPQDRENRTYLLVNPAEHRPQWELAELFDPELLALANVRYLISRDRITGPGLISLHQPERPWSVLSRRAKVEANLRANFTGRTHLYVYEYVHALPRFFLVERLRLLPTGDEVLDAMAAAGRDELAKTAFVEAPGLPSGLTEKPPLGGGSVRLEHYAGDEIRLSVDLDGAAVLVVTNAYSPYWKADVDGVETPIFPADHAFWGVALPATAHAVVFRYEPPYRLF